MSKKQKNRNQLWHELRSLWNQFDPIGVHKLCSQLGFDPPDDEYDDYIDPTLRLLESGADCQKLREYVSYIVTDYMEMNVNEQYLSDFILKIQEWFERVVVD